MSPTKAKATTRTGVDNGSKSPKLDLREDLYETELNGVTVMVGQMWLPLNKMIIDNRYQHALAESRAQRYAANWSQALAGLITVSERKKERVFAILDGQHRSRALQIRGEEQVWSEVFFDLTLQQEAYIFWQRNKERVPINSLDAFRSALTAGDERAQQVQAVLDKLKLHVGDQATNPSAYRAVAALSTLYGWGVLPETLAVTREAWPNELRVKEKPLLLGMGMLLWNFGAQLERKRLVKALGKQRLAKLLTDAATLKATLGQRDWEHMARLLVIAYNAEERHGRLDDTKLRPPSRRENK